MSALRCAGLSTHKKGLLCIWVTTMVRKRFPRPHICAQPLLAALPRSTLPARSRLSWPRMRTDLHAQTLRARPTRRCGRPPRGTPSHCPPRDPEPPNDDRSRAARDARTPLGAPRAAHVGAHCTWSAWPARLSVARADAAPFALGDRHAGVHGALTCRCGCAPASGPPREHYSSTQPCSQPCCRVGEHVGSSNAS